MQPQNQNPYDFIMSDAKPKRSLLPSGGNTKQRIMIVSVGALILIVLAIIVGSLLSSGGNSSKTDLTALAQQQAELIRVAGIGVTKSRDSTTQNLALTAQLTVESDQQSTLSALKKLGVKLSNKQLAASKNPQTDALLTQAEQTNQFDPVFTAQLQKQLTAYAASLKQTYQAATSKTTKQVLATQYQHAQLLAPKTSSSDTN